MTDNALSLDRLELFKNSWNYVTSSGSSTAESASDVSLSHLFHLFPGTCLQMYFLLQVNIIFATQTNFGNKTFENLHQF